MIKPKIFVSSTIYDFKDLRSSLKYWLEEMGFEPQLSEYNDFDKDSSGFSHDSCLKVISDCDYFILLLGSRVGGKYPGEDISITRKEYRTAYNMLKIGKIKKLLVFVRSSIWDVKEDRKGLIKYLEHCEIKDRDGNEISKDSIINFNSKIAKNADHIFSFIDEISRKDEINEGEKPLMNWINTFNTFEDIVSVLRTELLLKTNLYQKLNEQLVKSAVLDNSRHMSEVIEGKVLYCHNCFSSIRSIIKQYKDISNNNRLNMRPIILEVTDIDKLSMFLLFFRIGIDELNTFIFENAVSSGSFLDYSSEAGEYVNSNINKALIQLISEIKKLKESEKLIDINFQTKLLNKCRDVLTHKSDNRSFEYYDLVLLNSVYEKMFNIYELSKYIIRFIEKHEDNPFPSMLHGFISEGIPTDEQLLSDYLK